MHLAIYKSFDAFKKYVQNSSEISQNLLLKEKMAIAALLDKPPKPRHKELKSLTGIRSLAALWVFLYHIKAEIIHALPDIAWIIEGITGRGYLGVDLFFTLSGFILAYNYGDAFKKMDLPFYRNFLWLRLARIYPVHLFTLLLFLAAILVAKFAGITLTMPEFFNAPDFAKNLFLVQAWSVPVKPSWNTLSWSVSCEWLAYLTFPCCLVIFRGRGTAMLITSYLLLATILCNLTEIFSFTSTYSYGVLRIAFEFNIGIISFYLYKNNFGRWVSWCSISSILIIGFLILQFSPIGSTLPVFFMAPFFGVFILGLAYENCAFSKILSWKPFLYGGRFQFVSE